MEKPLILISHRFDQQVKVGLSLKKDLNFVYIKNLFEAPEALSKAKGLILRSSTQVDESFLKRCPQLEIVVTGTSGYDHIDWQEAKKRGVATYHVPDTQAVAASELTCLLYTSDAADD